jgi:DNA-binding beta-propeller fold protein YncE
VTSLQRVSSAIVIGALLVAGGQMAAQTQARQQAPVHEVDPVWMKVPEKMMMGLVRGLSIDSQDNVWIAQDTQQLTADTIGAAQNPPLAECCVPAPPVMQFDKNGNYIQGWGGPGQGYDWSRQIHGLFVDHKNNVWVSSERQGDHHIMKFDRSGKFLMQIGKPGASTGSNDRQNVNRAADMYVHPPTNELFVADGYGNRRIVVFDAETGAYKRHWGAYGNVPDDSVEATRRGQGAGAQQFNLPHHVRVSVDNLVYVADRNHNRIQVFTIDGKFVKEGYVARDTGTNNGTVYSLAFSRDRQQQFLYVADPANGRVRILNRETLTPLSFFGRWGHNPGEFMVVHNIETDSQGNLYATSIRDGRLQKFVYKGLR